MRIKKKEIQSEIFTGSMADISFLLIIYFMITSAFSADRGLDFALPEDTDTPEIKQEDSIDVHVLRGGAIEIDGNGTPLEGLLPYILDKLKQNPEKPVILRTDPDATYGDMIRAFDTLRTARIEWSDADGRPLHMDVHGKPLTDIQTISIPTRREIENLWSMLGIQ
jgi:biopolymer transport protein ExbD